MTKQHCSRISVRTASCIARRYKKEDNHTQPKSNQKIFERRITMKDYDLDKDEQELLDAFEAGEFVSIPNLEAEKTRLQKAARNAFNKTRNIIIFLSERDLYKLKAKGLEEGIPYQTLA